jgi:hypothetical protein
LSGVRQSKIIKQGASGRNGFTYTTKKNISKLTCLPVLFWWVCRSPSACGREAIIHLRVNYRYKRVQMVHILRLLHMMNVRFSLLNMAQRILGVTLPNF